MHAGRVVLGLCQQLTAGRFVAPAVRRASMGAVGKRHDLDSGQREPMHRLDIEPETPLLWAIRDELGLTGTKFGCGIAPCGACTVHIDGTGGALLLAAGRRVAGKSITTIEGLSPDGATSGAAGLARRGRAAMRLLPVRPDHGGGRASSRTIRTRSDAEIDATITAISAVAAPMSACAAPSIAPLR